MKNLILFLFAVFATSFCFSQEDIYVLIKETPDIEHIAYKSDTIQHDQYYIKLSPQKRKITLSIINGNLRKTSRGGVASRTTLNFIYQSINGNNNPTLIKKDSIKNEINYEEMILAKDYKNLLETLRSFKNVYLIDEASFFDGYYIAKKIERPSFLAQL